MKRSFWLFLTLDFYKNDLQEKALKIVISDRVDFGIILL